MNYSHSEIDQVKLYTIIDGNLYPCPLISANHSKLGSIRLKLLFCDDRKTDIYLLQTIDLKFPAPYQNIQGYIFTTEGCNPYKLKPYLHHIRLLIGRSIYCAEKKYTSFLKEHNK